MLNVKKLQAIRDKALGVTADPRTYGDLNSVVYLQQILDAVLGVTSTPERVRGNLNEKIYLQKIRNAKLGVADGQFGSLSNAIYLQQIINACNGVADGQFGNLSEDVYLDVLATVMSGAFNYYVNSVSGNDNNTGRSEGQAFATIAKVLTVMASGKKVGLAKGSTWHESFNAPVGGWTNVTVGAYGTGNRPILDCSDPIAAGAWSKTGGLTSVYQATLVIQTVGVADAFVRVWENGVALPAVASAAACDAAPGSYFASSSTISPMTLYVHATDGSNPGVSGITYEYNARGWGLCATDNCSGWTISGIETRRNLHGGGSLLLGKSMTVTDVICRAGTKHNVIFGDGCVFNSVQCIDAYYGGASFAMFIINDNVAAGLGVTLNDCSASLAAYSNSGGGYYSHVNTSGSFGTITLNRCSATNLLKGYDAGIDAVWVYNNCTATNCSQSFVPAVASTLNNPTIVTNRSDGIGMTLLGSVAIVITGGSITFTAAPSTQTGFFCAGVVPNFTMTGLHMKGGIYGIRQTNAGGSWNVHTCDFETMVRTYDTNAGGGTITSDFNRFREAGQDFRIQGVLYNNVADYVAATGQDTHSTTG